MESALRLRLVPDRQAAGRGERVGLMVEVENHKAGHAIPTGSTDLRLAWLEVKAAVDGALVPLPAASASGPAASGALSTSGAARAWDVAGAEEPDRALLGDDLPAGSRVYRAIYADGTGAPTLDSGAAVAIPFDNRLRAREVRREPYAFAVPAAAAGPVVFVARVYYLPYPSSFARDLGVAPAAPILMAEARAELALAEAPRGEP
jgi:hypothetical protein